MSDLAVSVIMLVIAIPSIVFHEVAHGYVAYRLGDPTAKSRGRLSLNPIKHIDPFGTVLLPMLLAAAGIPPFGYAKPVPIQPAYFKDYRKGMMLTGLAGPATNLGLAVVAGVIVRLLGVMPTVSGLAHTMVYYAWTACYLVVYFNLVLMFLNLIPIPPLDGSRVLPLFLSDEALRAYHRFERQGLLIVFAVIFIAPRLLNIDLLGGYFSATVDPLVHLLTGVAF